MNIICMGDSITYGHGLAAPAERWSALAEAATGHRMINCGVNGDTTAGMLSRCQWEVFHREEKADAMVLLGGINDLRITGMYQIPCANLTAMARQAAALQIPVIVGLPLPVSPEDMAASGWDAHGAANHLPELCRQYAGWISAYFLPRGFPVADFRTPFLRPDGTVRRELFQDGLHPTAEGHRLMAQVLCRLLAALGWQ